MNKRKRLPRDEFNRQTKDRTRKQILAAALSIARKYGLQAVKRDSVAAQAECGAGTVNFHFQTVTKLHHAVLIEAVRTRALRVIAEGIVCGHTAVARLDPALRAEAMASYTSC